MQDNKGQKLRVEELERKSISEFKGSEKIPVVLVLDNIRSLHNIGSIFRTADAFALQKLVLCGITAKPPHREIHKTALGATESVDWEYAENCFDAVVELKEQGFRAVGIEQVSGSQMLGSFEINDNQKLALIFGNEVNGVDQHVLNICEEFWEIPQYGTKHSLNISVSVGIVLWELRRNT